MLDFDDKSANGERLFTQVQMVQFGQIFNWSETLQLLWYQKV